MLVNKLLLSDHFVKLSVKLCVGIKTGDEKKQGQYYYHPILVL